MLQPSAVPVQGCPAIQAEGNAAAPSMRVPGKPTSRPICSWKGGRRQTEVEWREAGKENWRESHLHQGNSSFRAFTQGKYGERCHFQQPTAPRS